VDVILFDAAEQMTRFDWTLFKRRSMQAGGLVITSHRSGMLPTLIECTTDPALLSDIIRALLGTESMDFTRMTSDLHQRHNGNLRQALRELYDLYAAPRRFELLVNSGTDPRVGRFEQRGEKSLSGGEYALTDHRVSLSYGGLRCCTESRMATILVA